MTTEPRRSARVAERQKNGHECKGDLPTDGIYTSPIIECFEKDDGTLWVNNCEWLSQVAFCPYCGFEAHTKPEVAHD